MENVNFRDVGCIYNFQYTIINYCSSQHDGKCQDGQSSEQRDPRGNRGTEQQQQQQQHHQERQPAHNCQAEHELQPTNDGEHVSLTEQQTAERRQGPDRTQHLQPRHLGSEEFHNGTVQQSDPDNEDIEQGVLNSTRGLPNLGLTCYVNATLQCLRRVESFVKDLKTFGFIFDPIENCLIELVRVDELNDNQIRQVLKELFREFGLLHNTFAKENVQQDAAEYLQFMLQDLRKGSVIEEMDHGMIAKNFEVGYKTQRACRPLDVTESETFVITPLNLPAQATDIQAVIDRFFNLEPCQFCNGNNCASKKIIGTLPRALVLQLKRFNNANEKLQTPVQFLPSIQLRAHVAEDVIIPGSTGSNENVPSPSDENCTYYLQSMILHRGPSTTAGHYTAMIYDQASRSWILCNDENVQVVSNYRPFGIMCSRDAYVATYVHSNYAELPPSTLPRLPRVDIEPQSVQISNRDINITLMRPNNFSYVGFGRAGNRNLLGRRNYRSGPQSRGRRTRDHNVYTRTHESSSSRSRRQRPMSSNPGNETQTPPELSTDESDPSTSAQFCFCAPHPHLPEELDSSSETCSTKKLRVDTVCDAKDLPNHLEDTVTRKQKHTWPLDKRSVGYVITHKKRNAQHVRRMREIAEKKVMGLRLSKHDKEVMQNAKHIEAIEVLFRNVNPCQDAYATGISSALEYVAYEKTRNVNNALHFFHVLRRHYPLPDTGRVCRGGRRRAADRVDKQPSKPPSPRHLRQRVAVASVVDSAGPVEDNDTVY